MTHARSVEEFSLEQIANAKHEAESLHKNINYHLRFEYLFNEYVQDKDNIYKEDTENEINIQFKNMLNLRYSMETIAVYSTLYAQLRDLKLKG